VPKECLAEPAPAPRFIDHDVLDEDACPEDRRGDDFSVRVDEEAKLRVELAVAEELREPDVERFYASAALTVSVLEERMESLRVVSSKL